MAPVLEMGPTTRWVGLEILVDMVLEGCSLLALADSGSQVNTMMPKFVKVQGYPVFTVGRIGGLLPAPGRAGQSMHPSSGIHNCEATGEGGGRI